MKTCSLCGRSVADDDGLLLTDGRFFCESGGCRSRFLSSVVENEVVPDIIRSGGQVIKLVSPESPANSRPSVLDDSRSEPRQPCELCHRQPINGNHYRFYYGKKTDTSFIGFLLALRRTGSPPLITERESVWICPKCVKLRTFLRYGLQALLLLISIALLADTFLGGPSSPILPALGLMALGILILTFPPRGEKEIGERLAVSIKRKALRRQGYNVFLTSKQFAKLR